MNDEVKSIKSIDEVSDEMVEAKLKALCANANVRKLIKEKCLYYKIDNKDEKGLPFSISLVMEEGIPDINFPINIDAEGFLGMVEPYFE